jgi:O-antigen/teichoic acid export membrane protein
MLLGQPLFALVFGEEWRQAGQIASIVVLLAASRLVTTPSTAAVPVLALQRAHFFVDGLRLVGTTIAVVVGASFGSLFMALIGVVLIGIIADLVVTVLVLRA